MDQHRHYFDANATTPLCSAAKTAVVEALDSFGNPSSTHAAGRATRERVEAARIAVAAAAGVPAKELVFTSGGTESNAAALFGSFAVHVGAPFELVTATTEHSSVLDAVQELERRGARVRFVPLNSAGTADPAALEKLLGDRTANIVSIMAANNETGALSDIPALAAIAARHGAWMHVDAVQALGKVESKAWNDVDLLSLSAHKIQGPKGAGALVIRRGRKLSPLLFGGSQERKRRGGTENLLGILGFGAAAGALRPEAWSALADLRDRLEAKLVEGLPNVVFHGQSGPRLPNTTNLRFAGIDAAVLLSALDLDGFAVSAGSACSSGSIAPSHVLQALGLNEEDAREGLRFALGPWHDEASVDSLAEAVIGHVLRILARRSSVARPPVTASLSVGL